MLPHAADWAAAVSGPGADAQHLPPAANAQGQMADQIANTSRDIRACLAPVVLLLLHDFPEPGRSHRFACSSPRTRVKKSPRAAVHGHAQSPARKPDDSVLTAAFSLTLSDWCAECAGQGRSAHRLASARTDAGAGDQCAGVASSAEVTATPARADCWDPPEPAACRQPETRDQTSRADVHAWREASTRQIEGSLSWFPLPWLSHMPCAARFGSKLRTEGWMVSPTA